MKAVEPGATAITAKSEGMAARLPAHVLALPAPQQIGWLDSQEACALFKRKTRQRFRKTIIAQLAELSRQAMASAPTTVAVVEDIPAEEWPVWYVATRRASELGTPAGTTPCRCRYCDEQRAHWPPYYVSRWLTGLAAVVNRKRRRPRLSWECFLERNPPRREVVEFPTMTDAEAEQAGFSVRKSCKNSRGPLPPLVDGCAGCGGKRRQDNKFCRTCEAAARKEMTASGYFGAEKM